MRIAKFTAIAMSLACLCGLCMSDRRPFNVVDAVRAQEIAPSRKFQHAPSWVEDVLKRIESDDRQARADACRELRDAYESLVVGFEAMAAQEKPQHEWGDSRQVAVEFLGKMPGRAQMAILVDSIEYQQPMVITEVTLLGGYPCALALRDIGQSSVPEILRYLASRNKPKVVDGFILDQVPRGPVSDKAIELYAGVLAEIYGPNEGGLDEAIRVVRGMWERRSKQEDLQRLLDALEDIKRARTRPDQLEEIQRGQTPKHKDS